MDGVGSAVAVLAGVAAAAPGEDQVVPGLHVEAGWNRDTFEGEPGVHVITSAAAWGRFQAGFRENIRPPTGEVPPPVDFRRASLVALVAHFSSPMLPFPVLTRVDAAPPGVVEVVQPHVDYLLSTPQVVVHAMRLWKVAKLPEGSDVRVTCVSAPSWCSIGASPSPLAR